MALCLGLAGCPSKATPPTPSPAPEQTATSSTATSQLVVEPAPGGAGFWLPLHWDNLMKHDFEKLEAAGFYPNGPAWLGVIEFLASRPPAITGLDYDDSSDSVSVYAAQAAPLRALRDRIERARSTPATLEATFRAAKAAGFAPGDL